MMARPIKRKTELMRVPCNFKNLVKDISRKRGYDSNTEFLDTEGVRLFKNSDYLGDIFGRVFYKKKR